MYFWFSAVSQMKYAAFFAARSKIITFVFYVPWFLADVDIIQFIYLLTYLP